MIFFGENFLGEKVLLDLYLFSSVRAGTQVDAGQGRWSPEKEQGFSQRELAV